MASSIPFVGNYLREIKYVSETILIDYPILDMEIGDGEESGLDYIPENDAEILTVYAIAKEFNFAYEHLESMQYSEYLRWLARYKALQWRPKSNGRGN